MLRNSFRHSAFLGFPGVMGAGDSALWYSSPMLKFLCRFRRVTRQERLQFRRGRLAVIRLRRPIHPRPLPWERMGAMFGCN
jgi:hypothetical protein